MGDYCTLDEVKSELGIEEDDKDGMLAGMIEQASSFIDVFCKREFSASTATRYFDGARLLHISDLLTVTTLKLDQDGDGVFEVTMATSDYILYPLNDTPKTMIKISRNSSYGSFADGIEKGVQIAGSWGYATTAPKPIRRAAIIQTCRWFKRKDSAFSDVVGSAETGEIIMYKGLDPDIKLLLEKYIKVVYA